VACEKYDLYITMEIYYHKLPLINIRIERVNIMIKWTCSSNARHMKYIQNFSIKGPLENNQLKDQAR
jgi:hypothetical protein